MDSIKIRELEEKSIVSAEDTIVVEDNTGTLQVPISTLQNMLQASLFCKNINELKQSVFNAGDVVETLGYHTAGDGGMATYLIVDAPDESDNGITIISLLTSDRLKAHLLYDNYISPLQAGAYGDGVHDDSQVIEDMQYLDLPIKFPKKTFVASIRIHDNDVINFNGCTIKYEDIAIIIDDSNITVENVTIGSTGGYAISCANKYNITIRNCTFISYCDSSAINIYNCNKVSISHCLFVEPSEYTALGIIYISTIDKFNSTTIDHCTFSNIKSIAVITSGRTLISDCDIWCVDGRHEYNIVSDGYCKISNCLLRGRGATDAMTNSCMVIENTQVQDITTHAFYGSIGSTITISKLCSVNGRGDKYSDQEVLHSDSTVHIDGYLMKDTDIRPNPSYTSKIYSHIMNNSYDEALPVETEQYRDISIFDISKYLKTLDHVSPDVAVKITNPSYTLGAITGGIEGQVIAIYQSAIAFNYDNIREDRICSGSGNWDASTMVGKDNPIIVKYDNKNKRWLRIK